MIVLGTSFVVGFIFIILLGYLTTLLIVISISAYFVLIMAVSFFYYQKYNGRKLNLYFYLCLNIIGYFNLTITIKIKME